MSALAQSPVDLGSSLAERDCACDASLASHRLCRSPQPQHLVSGSSPRCSSCVPATYKLSVASLKCLSPSLFGLQYLLQRPLVLRRGDGSSMPYGVHLVPNHADVSVCNQSPKVRLQSLFHSLQAPFCTSSCVFDQNVPSGCVTTPVASLPWLWP